MIAYDNKYRRLQNKRTYKNYMEWEYEVCVKNWDQSRDLDSRSTRPFPIEASCGRGVVSYCKLFSVSKRCVFLWCANFTHLYISSSFITYILFEMDCRALQQCTHKLMRIPRDWISSFNTSQSGMSVFLWQKQTTSPSSLKYGS